MFPRALLVFLASMLLVAGSGCSALTKPNEITVQGGPAPAPPPAQTAEPRALPPGTMPIHRAE